MRTDEAQERAQLEFRFGLLREAAANVAAAVGLHHSVMEETARAVALLEAVPENAEDLAPHAERALRDLLPFVQAAIPRTQEARVTAACLLRAAAEDRIGDLVREAAWQNHVHLREVQASRARRRHGLLGPLVRPLAALGLAAHNADAAAAAALSRRVDSDYASALKRAEAEVMNPFRAAILNATADLVHKECATSPTLTLLAERLDEAVEQNAAYDPSRLFGSRSP